MFCSKRQMLDLYPIDLNNQRQNTTAFSHTEPAKKSLKAYYTTEPAALQAFRQIQVGQYDVTLSGLTADHLSQNDGWQCQILGFFRDQFLFKLLFQIIHFLD